MYQIATKLDISLSRSALHLHQGTMINFSVSRSGFNEQTYERVRKQKTKPSNKHAYPYTRTCNPTFHLHDSQKKALFCWFFLSALSILGIVFKREEEEERERPFLFKLCSRRSEKLNKGRASWNRPRDELKIWQIRKGQNCFFFFLARPWNQCARRTKNREFNHFAPKRMRFGCRSRSYPDRKKSG